MSLSIQTNYANLVGQHTINKTQNALTTSMERLSTGYRINSASDDAAGLQISNRLEAQGRGMNVAMRNAGDATSQMQTAEGAMDEMTNIAYRMSDLATQSANGTASDSDREAMQTEFGELADELSSIMDNTNLGGQKLLKADEGTFAKTGGVTYQIGATADETLNVDVADKLAAIQSSVSELGSNIDITTATGAMEAMAMLTGDSSVGASGGATGSFRADTESSFIDQIGTARSSFGANINRLDHTVANLGNMIENTASAKSRIMDTDMASESSAMAKNQMLMQSGAQMLQQSKMIPQLAMSLL